LERFRKHPYLILPAGDVAEEVIPTGWIAPVKYWVLFCSNWKVEIDRDSHKKKQKKLKNNFKIKYFVFFGY